MRFSTDRKLENKYNLLICFIINFNQSITSYIYETQYIIHNTVLGRKKPVSFQLELQSSMPIYIQHVHNPGATVLQYCL